MGLTVLAAGALPHVAQLPISDLYHAPGVPGGDQATLVFLWEASQGLFDALLITGLCVMPVALLVLGVGMRRTPSFGRVSGWVSIGLGIIGLVSAVALLVEPGSSIAVGGVISLILFNLIIGWRVFTISKTG